MGLTEITKQFQELAKDTITKQVIEAKKENKKKKRRSYTLVYSSQ